MEVPVLHLVCVDVLLDGLDHAVLIVRFPHSIYLMTTVIYILYMYVLFSTNIFVFYIISYMVIE